MKENEIFTPFCHLKEVSVWLIDINSSIPQFPEHLCLKPDWSFRDDIVLTLITPHLFCCHTESLCPVWWACLGEEQV